MTWEYERDLTGGWASADVRQDMKQARETRRTPSSMYERLHVRAADSACTDAKWTHRQRLAAACKQARPADEDMSDLWMELQQQARCVHGGTWQVGSAREMTSKESASDEKRWTLHVPEPTDTNYPGEQEVVREQHPDGSGYVETRRTTIGLAPDRRWIHMTAGDRGGALGSG